MIWFCCVTEPNVDLILAAHQYAANGSITAIDIERVMNMEYEFDEQGRIVGIDENGTLRRYAYSRLGLTMQQSEDTTHRFEYDTTGNRRASSVQKADGTLSATVYDYPNRAQCCAQNYRRWPLSLLYVVTVEFPIMGSESVKKR